MVQSGTWPTTGRSLCPSPGAPLPTTPGTGTLKAFCGVSNEPEPQFPPEWASGYEDKGTALSHNVVILARGEGDSKGARTADSGCWPPLQAAAPRGRLPCFLHQAGLGPVPQKVPGPGLGDPTPKISSSTLLGVVASEGPEAGLPGALGPAGRRWALGRGRLGRVGRRGWHLLPPAKWVGPQRCGPVYPHISTAPLGSS